MRPALLLATLALFTAAGPAADPRPDKPRDARQVRKEIEELKAKLKLLEAELARAEGVAWLSASTIEVGMVGRFGDGVREYPIEVLEVGGSEFYTARVRAGAESLTVVVSRHPTKGLGVGKVLKDPPLWYVKGVMEHDQTRSGLKGSYILYPADRRDPPKPTEPAPVGRRPKKN